MWWALLACTGEVVQTPDGQVVLSLVNPTDADPTLGVAEYRLVLEMDGSPVATTVSSQGLPGLPDLQEYGVGVFELTGFDADDQIVSFGRTAPVLLSPEVDREIPLLFLPVNQVLPVTAWEMGQPRSDHVAWVEDGQVTLGGGRSPAGDQVFQDLQGFTLTEGFSALGELPVGVASASLLPRDDGMWVLGGESWIADTWQPVAAVQSWDGVAGAAEGQLSSARTGACFFQFDEQTVVGVGGADATGMEVYRGEDFGEILVEGFSPAGAQGCAALSEGLGLVQGLTADSSGVLERGASWRFTELALSLRQAPMVLSLPDGVWIGAGLSDAGTPLQSAVRVDAETLVIEDLPAPSVRIGGQAEPWIEAGHAVLACGEDELGAPHGTVEVLELSSGQGVEVAMDRDRSGCRASVLPDGSVLITGGFSTGQQLEPGAALLVPVW